MFPQDENYSQRMLYNVEDIYKDWDKGTQQEEDVIKGKEFDDPSPYDELKVFERFKTLFDFENGSDAQQIKLHLMEAGKSSESNVDMVFTKGAQFESKYEEAKRQYVQSKGLTSGIQIWGLGHMYAWDDPGYMYEFEGKEDDDLSDMEVDDEEAKETYELTRKILDDNH